jgi:virginiamycin B lyase
LTVTGKRLLIAIGSGPSPGPSDFFAGVETVRPSEIRLPVMVTILLNSKAMKSIAVACCAAAILAVVLDPPSAAAQTFAEFPLPNKKSAPSYMTAGADGALWFAELGSNKIGRITIAGALAEFQIPTPNSEPYSIAAGPDGNVWFVEHAANKIGRITPSGKITEFDIPTARSEPLSIAAGPDNAMWFLELNTGKVGRITLEGAITEFPNPDPDRFGAQLKPTEVFHTRVITAGPDGNLWFTEAAAANRIVRITPTGDTAQFPIPTPASSLAGILAGPDGALWFAEEDGNKIGRITTSGVITEFPLPTPNSLPRTLTVGADGALWFTQASDRIGRITTDGAITEFTTPTAIEARGAGVPDPRAGNPRIPYIGSPYGIATAADGTIWFTEQKTGKIARLTPPSPPADKIKPAAAQ